MQIVNCSQWGLEAISSKDQSRLKVEKEHLLVD